MVVYKLHENNIYSDGEENTFYSDDGKAIKALEDIVGKEELRQNGVWGQSGSVVYYSIEISNHEFMFYSIEAINVL